MQHGIQQMRVHKTYAAPHQSCRFDKVPDFLMCSFSNLRHCIHIPQERYSVWKIAASQLSDDYRMCKHVVGSQLFK